MYSHLWFLSALAKTHMAETKTKISITQPKATAIKKPNDAILDAGCHRLKRFWKANRIVYVKMCGTIT